MVKDAGWPESLDRQKAGSQILRQGEQARGLHLVLSGFVDIIDTETGERIDCDGAG